MSKTPHDVDPKLDHTSTLANTRTRTSTVTRVVAQDRGRWASFQFRFRTARLAVGRSLRNWWRQVSDTLTPGGWLMSVVVFAGAVLGPVLGWALGWLMLVSGTVLLLMAVPFLLGGHDFDVRLRLERDRVVAGHEVAGEVEVRNRSGRPALPAVIDVPVGEGLVEAHVPLMAAGGVHHEPLEISAQRRGVIEVGPMTLSRSDPLGILRREVTWPDRQTIFVHPQTAPLPTTSSGQIHDLEGMTSNQIVAADLAFHAIREYVHGDSLRHVHWRSTAKAGKLMVREYEESRRSRLAVLLALNETDFLDADEVELAVSVAASLGAQGIRDGRDMFVAASAEPRRISRNAEVSITTLPITTARGFLDATCELASTPRSTRVEDVAAVAAQTCAEMTVAFLVVGSQLELNRISSAAMGLPLGTMVVAIRCEVDGEPSVRSTRDVSVITVGALADLGRLLARGVLR